MPPTVSGFAVQLPPQSGLQHSRSRDREIDSSTSVFKQFKLILDHTWKSTKSFYAELLSLVNAPEPYRRKRASDFTPVNCAPIRTLPGDHEELMPPDAGIIRRHVELLEKERRTNEVALDIQVGQPRSVTDLLSVLTGDDDFLFEREMTLAKLKDDAAEILSQWTEAQAKKSPPLRPMRKELLMAQVERAFLRSLLEFHAIFLAYITDGRATVEDGKAIYWRAHFETRPLSTKGFLAERHQRLLVNAQEHLFERLIMAEVRRTIGTEPEVVRSPRMEKLFCEFFEQEAETAMKKFLDQFPDCAEHYRHGAERIIPDFKEKLTDRLGKSGFHADYINKKMIPALKAAQLKTYNLTGRRPRYFKGLEEYLRPSILLTRASERLVVEIVRREQPR